MGMILKRKKKADCRLQDWHGMIDKIKCRRKNRQGEVEL